MRRLIQPAPRSAVRELHVVVPEEVRDDEAHFVVGEAEESTNQHPSSSAYRIMRVHLLHAETVPRTSGERLKDALLVVRESCIVAFDARRQPAFREEAVAVYEVVGRMVGGEMGDADSDLGMVMSARLRKCVTTLLTLGGM